MTTTKLSKREEREKLCKDIEDFLTLMKSKNSIYIENNLDALQQKSYDLLRQTPRFVTCDQTQQSFGKASYLIKYFGRVYEQDQQVDDLYESVKKLKLTLARIADDKRENQQSPHIQNKKSNRASKNIETQMQFQDLSHCCQHPYFDLYGKTMLINHIQEQSNIDKTVNMQDITDWQVYESLRKRINEEYLTIFGTHAVKNLSVGSEDSTKCEVVSDSVETNQVLSSLFKSSFSQSMMDTPLSHSLNEVRQGKQKQTECSNFQLYYVIGIKLNQKSLLSLKMNIDPHCSLYRVQIKLISI